jgi:hypothetical protein
MKILLLNFLSLVFSAYVLAAEPITYNGKEGIFIEKDKAAKLLETAQENESLKKQISLLEKQVKLLEENTEIMAKKIDVEEEISLSWRTAFEVAQKGLSSYKSKDDLTTYIYVGLFVGGTIVGAGVMYGASHLLNNIR